MSGHSKWAKIKRAKGASDARKGVVFTKLARELQVAAREGGPDPDMNVRLRLAVQKARESNMPADNIKRSIEKATGAGNHEQFEEITYEGYGPGGAAILVAAMTDNRNRTVSDVRAAFTRAGGSLGEAGCVAWLFQPRGVIAVEAGGLDPDEVALNAIDAGAEDVKTEGSAVEIYTTPETLERVRAALSEQKLAIEHAESTLLPTTTVALDDERATQVLKLVDRLEELDDVQRVYTNVEFQDSVLEAAAG
jgi:YebC/PmpR family DNA-binding regulatory protein